VKNKNVGSKRKNVENTSRKGEDKVRIRREVSTVKLD